jgi:hypothetical protein
MSTLYRVKQPKNCDYVGWQTYGRIVEEMSWASSGLMWGSVRIFVDAAAGGLWAGSQIATRRASGRE